MMGIRLLELHRILKATGAIYLHCDDTANFLLRACLDAVFGASNYRNEIVWKRSTRSDGRRFGRTHDLLLCYGMSSKTTWNKVVTGHTSEWKSGFYRYSDERGRFGIGDLSGAGTRTGESGSPWRGHDPTMSGRHWAAPHTGDYATWIDANVIPGYRDIEGVMDRLDALDEHDMIRWPAKQGGWPMLKRYAKASPGRQVNDVFDDIKPLRGFNSKERTGWQTQKPLALLQRIIKASSNPDDLVLDPFCGCATACVAAEVEGRQWIGIDACDAAEDITRVRLADVSMDWYDELLHVTRKPPTRTDADAPNIDKRTRKYRTEDNIDRLYGEQRGDCPGCGNHYRWKDMHIDHVVPVAGGGSDDIANLQLLCGHCNSTKHDGTMAELWDRLVENGVISEADAASLRDNWPKRTTALVQKARASA